MDYMFQFDQRDELFQSFPPPFQFQPYTTQQAGQQPPSPTEDSTHLSTHKLSSGSWRRKSSSLTFDELIDSNPSEIKKRKIMHRDVERQRRQEMATHHASLRTLLPVEYLKGKRSISDHMHQAVNYIRHLQNKIEELSNKRDRLQKLCSPSSYHTGTRENSQGATQDVVTVRPCWAGVEVVISTALEEGLPLSRVLQALIREGLSIINCNSTKVKERLLHTIESEVKVLLLSGTKFRVYNKRSTSSYGLLAGQCLQIPVFIQVINGGRKIDLSELQQKLTSLISQS